MSDTQQPWFFGQDLIGGYLVLDDSRYTVAQGIHLFAPRPRPEEPELMQFWPICPLGEREDARGDSGLAYCSPADERPTCGQCLDAVNAYRRLYNFVTNSTARFVGKRPS